MPETRVLKGAVLTEGITAGRVCLYQEDVLEASPRYEIPSQDTEKEIQRFRDAREKTKAELRAVHEEVSRKLSKIEAEVFNMHILILEDAAFAGEIERYIAEKLINAESAIVDTVTVYEGKFKALPNHYFRERIQDVNDIARRLINNLGIEHKGFMCSGCQGSSAIVAASNLTSTLLAGLQNKNVAGIIAEKGSTISHAAILARAMGVPALINVDGMMPSLSCGTEVIIDAVDGRLYISPDNEILSDYRKKLALIKKKPQYKKGYITTKDGIRVNLLANAGNLFDITHAREHNIRDIGLFRTEFLFLGRDTEPSVEEQVKSYREIMDSVEGTVTFRLLDIGGDKILDFMSLPEEENPNLGLRGSRIYDLYPELINNQIEALLLAKGKKPVNLLIPMVSTLKEFLSVRDKIRKKARGLKERGVEPENLKIGCMIEVPSAVYLISYLYQEADFLSIGTNDLIQYIMGVDRNNSRLADLASPFQPAVLKVLSEIIRTIRAGSKEVVVCGEIASDPEMVKVLVGLGYRNLSINVHAVDKMGENLSAYTAKQLEEKVKTLLEARTLDHIVDVFLKKQEGVK